MVFILFFFFGTYVFISRHPKEKMKFLLPSQDQQIPGILVPGRSLVTPWVIPKSSSSGKYSDGFFGTKGGAVTASLM